MVNEIKHTQLFDRLLLTEDNELLEIGYGNIVLAISNLFHNLESHVKNNLNQRKSINIRYRSFAVTVN